MSDPHGVSSPDPHDVSSPDPHDVSSPDPHDVSLPDPHDVCSSDLYDVSLYQITHRGNAGDIAFYRRVCRGAETVLELGCGWGRVMRPLLEAGHRVTGLDLHPDMIAALQQRLSSAPDAIRDRASLILADMSEFSLPQRFDRVLIPYNGLYVLLSESAQRACLQRAFDHLVAGGELWLDLYQVDLDASSEEAEVSKEQTSAEEAEASKEQTSAEEAEASKEQTSAEEAEASKEQTSAEEAEASKEQTSAEEAEVSKEQASAEEAEASKEQTSAEEAEVSGEHNDAERAEASDVGVDESAEVSEDEEVRERSRGGSFFLADGKLVTFEPLASLYEGERCVDILEGRCLEPSEQRWDAYYLYRTTEDGVESEQVYAIPQRYLHQAQLVSMLEEVGFVIGGCYCDLHKTPWEEGDEMLVIQAIRPRSSRAV
ncbi:methyltransferase domain-containing protein [Myxococcota bacterium]|nr:methyltransferase domain-containing protein [Myxococcota bacterium]